MGVCQAEFEKQLLQMGAKPIGRNRNGMLWDGTASCLDAACAIQNEEFNYFERRVGNMTKDIDKATEITEVAIKNFGRLYEQFMKVERNFTEQAKKSAGSVKDASEKIQQGIIRIEKAANFQRLEQYVSLLERAATAMNMLAELEKTGKLEKIAASIR